MQADGEGSQEQSRPGQQRGELREPREWMLRQEDGVGREAGRQPQQKMVGSMHKGGEPTGAGDASVMQRGVVEVEELEADEEERHQCGEDLAGASRRQPAFHPYGNHAREEDVHRGVDCEDDKCCGGKRRIRDGDADGRGKQCKAADDGAGCQQSEQHAQDEIPAEAQRKAQQRGGVEAGGGGGDAGSTDSDELPYEGDAPEQYTEPLRMVAADCHPGEETGSYHGAYDP